MSTEIPSEILQLIQALRESTENLTTQVQSLAGALGVVNALQLQQIKTDAMSLAALAASEEQRELASHLIREMGEKGSTASVTTVRRRGAIASAVGLVFLLLLSTQQIFVIRAARRACDITRANAEIAIRREELLGVSDKGPSGVSHRQSANAFRKNLQGCHSYFWDTF